MSPEKEKRDKHFPLFVHSSPLRRLFSHPEKFNAYADSGQVVADLGCGPGYFTIPLAECVGPVGKVYAVDSDERAIQVVKKKARKHGYSNIEALAGSAHDLSFIGDASVDFVLSCGLLCSMAPQYHEAAVNEMKRILKPSGKAYVDVAKGRISYVDKAEWEDILRGFRVEQRGDPVKDIRWAVVTLKRQ